MAHASLLLVPSLTFHPDLAPEQLRLSRSRLGLRQLTTENWIFVSPGGHTKTPRSPVGQKKFLSVLQGVVSKKPLSLSL